MRTALEASFRLDCTVFRFTLNDAGLPSEWTKLRNGEPVIRVEYRSYVAVPVGKAETVRLPERIRVFAGDPQPRLILGIQEWQMVPEIAPITFIPPHDVVEKFRAQ
jgi:hypothetical protein